MAFVKDKTGVGQTAANAAATVVAAFIETRVLDDFDSAVKVFADLRHELFEELAAIVDADNEAFAAQGGSDRPARKSSGGSAKRTGKTGGRSHGGGGKSSITLDDARTIELNFGAFKGVTLEDLLDITVDEADEEYGYGDGERSGKDYIAWLASDSNKNKFIQQRARLVADDAGIEYDD
jgi:hypothetical protein